MADHSKLVFYSLGVVAMNKSINPQDAKINIIEVTPVEHFPMLNGEITDNATQQSTTGTDSNGVTYQDTVTQAATVKATWLRRGDTNQITSPNVRRGSKVDLWRYADADAYYWTVHDDDSKLRKLETVTYAWSATKDETVDTDASNSYVFHVSSHEGIIQLQTTKANAEPFAYSIQINTKTGYIGVQDDIGNAFRLDSKGQRIVLINSAGTSHDLNGTNSTITCPATHTVQAKDIVMNASNSITTTTSTNTLKATTNTMTTSTTHNGNLSLNGDMTTLPNADVGATGQINMRGDLNLDGVATFVQGANVGGTLTANQIVSTQNIIAPNV